MCILFVALRLYDRYLHPVDYTALFPPSKAQANTPSWSTMTCVQLRDFIFTAEYVDSCELNFFRSHSGVTQEAIGMNTTHRMMLSLPLKEKVNVEAFPANAKSTSCTHVNSIKGNFLLMLTLDNVDFQVKRRIESNESFDVKEMVQAIHDQLEYLL